MKFYHMLPLRPWFLRRERQRASWGKPEERCREATENGGRTVFLPPDSLTRDGMAAPGYAFSLRRRSSISITWRPRYCPHDGQTWCGSFGERQLLHGTRFGAVMK